MAKAYWEKLQDPRWQKKRLEILNRAGFKCEMCGSVSQMLHVHHGYYERGVDPWDYENDSLTALCVTCHKDYQSTLADIHREVGLLKPSRYMAVMSLLIQMKMGKAIDAMDNAREQGLLMSVWEDGTLVVDGPEDVKERLAGDLNEWWREIVFCLETKDGSEP